MNWNSEEMSVNLRKRMFQFCKEHGRYPADTAEFAECKGVGKVACQEAMKYGLPYKRSFRFYLPDSQSLCCCGMC